MVSQIDEDTLKFHCERYLEDIEFDVDLSMKNSIHVGGTGFAWYTPKSVKDLSVVLSILSQTNIAWKVIGSGSNVLFSDGLSDVLYISLKEINFQRIEGKNNHLYVGAGSTLGSVIAGTVYKGLAGFEFLVGIPGTIGGAINMNASYKASISDFLLKVLILDQDGSLQWFEKEKIAFSYRKSLLPKCGIILEAVFALKKSDTVLLKKGLKKNMMEKLSKQPLASRTLGCTFKNPEDLRQSSGQLIDKAGLKGVSCGDAVISEQHANFIINKGAATSKDVIKLIDIAKETVRCKFGVSLELEIDIV